MISQLWVAMMAAYNAEMNRRLYAAAGRLTEEERRAERGAFFGSIHATLNHLLWADLMWMSRLDAWDKPAAALREAMVQPDTFAGLWAARQQADSGMADWAARVTPDFLADETAWFSTVAQRAMQHRNAVLVTHLFNHQTHHRGQVHAMLTAAGQSTGDTDLVLLPGIVA